MNDFTNGFTMSQLTELLYSLPGTLIAIVVHEYMHAFVSYKLGDPTPKRDGRLSMNPLHHLDPIGTLCLLVFHFGWAKPVVINPGYYKNQRTGSILVSLAGPLSNLVLAMVFLMAAALTANFGGFLGRGPLFTLVMVLYSTSLINLGLAVFNLIPIPPLDGSHVLEALIPALKPVFRGRYEIVSVILVVLLMTGIISKPLTIVENVLLAGMWKIAYGLVSVLA
jgi:Zn-dependent protease